MRRLADFAIIAAFSATSVPYVLEGRWWVVLACSLTGLLWLFQSQHGAELGLNLSLLLLTSAAAAGIFLNHTPLWVLTNLVVLLVAWDLDHFRRELQQFSCENLNEKAETALFHARLKRLGIVTGLGFGFGLIALKIRVSIGFAGALVLAAIALLSLAQVVRFLRREMDSEND